MKQQFQTSAGSREHPQNKGEGGRDVRCARTRREPSPHQRNRVLINICHPKCPPCHRPGVPHRSWYTGTSPGSTARIFNEHFCVTCQLLSDQHLPSETARSLHIANVVLALLCTIWKMSQTLTTVDVAVSRFESALFPASYPNKLRKKTRRRRKEEG